MDLLLILGSFLSYCCGLSAILEIQPAFVPMLTVSFWVVASFFGGFWHHLPEVRTMIFYGGWLGFFVPLFFEKRRQKIINFLCSPVFCVTALAVGVIFLGIKHPLTMDGDYRNTGLMLKQMSLMNCLPDGKFSGIFRSYHPGPILFFYDFFKFRPYDESTLYLANAVFDFAALATVFVGSVWIRPWDILAKLFFIIVAVKVIGQGFACFYVDQHLGVYFGGILVAYYLGGRRIRFWFALPLANLSLIKHPGIFFSTFALITMLIDQLAINYVRKDKSKRELFSEYLPTIGLISFCEAVAYLPHALWKYYAHKFGAVSLFLYNSWSASSLMPWKLQPERGIAIKEVSYQFLVSGVGGLIPFSPTRSLPLWGWIMLFCCAIFYLVQDRAEKKQLPVFITVMLGLILWVFAVYVLYMNDLLTAERFSAVRYTSSYVLGLFIFFGTQILARLSKKRDKAITFVLATIVFAINPNWELGNESVGRAEGTLILRENMEKLGVSKVFEKLSNSDLKDQPCFLPLFNPRMDLVYHYFLYYSLHDRIIDSRVSSPTVVQTRLHDCRRIYLTCDSQEFCEKAKQILELEESKFTDFEFGTHVLDRKDGKWSCTQCSLK